MSTFSPVQLRPGMRRWFRVACLVITVVFCALHFVSLGADFPGKWPEHAALTDEGWYGKAAVSDSIEGTWRLEGDFNPAVATPLFPIMEAALFRVTGRSIVAARALEVGWFLVVVAGFFLLTSRAVGVDYAALGCVLLSTSYYCFAFSRLAILEVPALGCLVLAACCAERVERPWLRGALAGIFVLLAMLVKLSSGFAVPAIAYLMFVRARDRRSMWISNCAAALPLVAGLAAFRLLLAGRYMEDSAYFTSINIKARLHISGMGRTFLHALFEGHSVGWLFFAAAILSIAILIWTRGWMRNRLFVFSLLWAAAYVAYMTVIHYPPPRYYTTLVIPFAIWVLLAAQSAPETNNRWRFAILVLVAGSIVGDAYQIVRDLRAPRHTLVNMAYDIREVMAADGQSNAVVAGHFANTISLISGVRSLNDEFGSRPFGWRLDRYQPGYFVSEGTSGENIWGPLRSRYQPVAVKSYDVFDGNIATHVVLYRLLPMGQSSTAAR